MILKLALIFFLCLTKYQFGNCLPQKQYCPLSWTATTLGEFPEASVAVSIFTKDAFVCRVQINKIYISGYADVKTGFCHALDNPNQETYEVLTNTNSCKLSWNDDCHNICVKTDLPSSNYLGRASIDTGGESARILSGEVQNGVLKIEGQFPTPNFQYLQSFSEGLNVEVIDFELSGDEIEVTLEMVGIDEIHNRSPVLAQQILLHRTKITETRTLTTTRTWGKTWGLSASVSVGSPPFSATFKVGYEFQDDHVRSNTIHQETENEISITRELTISPFTTVQACSWLTLIDDFNQTYTAKYKYTVPGLTASQVNYILKSDGILDGTENSDNSVHVKTSGYIAGKLAANTKMVVLPFEGGTGGCTEMTNLIKKSKTLKTSKGVRSKDYEKVTDEINEIMQRATILSSTQL